MVLIWAIGELLNFLVLYHETSKGNIHVGHKQSFLFLEIQVQNIVSIN